jgi:hypothetical protein
MAFGSACGLHAVTSTLGHAHDASSTRERTANPHVLLVFGLPRSLP